MTDAPFRVLPNPRPGVPGMVVLPAGGYRRARAEISAWPGYEPTPLHDLPAVAAELGIGVLRVKDEAGRFGLGSFKALGGAYAVLGVIAAELARAGVVAGVTAEELEGGRFREATQAITVTCATDGNHGRSVAWAAQRFGCRAVIVVHPGVSAARRQAMAAFGAEIHEVPGNYDDAVRASLRLGFHVISDTSWSGYTEIPRDIMQGYRLMPDEALAQWTGPPPTHVIIQAGVGGVAAAVSVQVRAAGLSPALIIVEPDGAACLYASAAAGKIVAVPGPHDTLMAGLACGEPSLLAWQELERSAAAFVTIPDSAAVAGMRLLARHGIVSGETGAAGVGALLLLARDEVARETLGLALDSRVLAFSCEGATDPAQYARLIG